MGSANPEGRARVGTILQPRRGASADGDAGLTAMTARRFDARAALACVAIVLFGLSASSAGRRAGPRSQAPPAAPARDRATPAATGRSRIRGRIVSAETGAPLRRVQVTLTGESDVRRQVT